MKKSRTWESEFKARYEKLPKNRKYETVVALREIIRDMHEAEYPAAAIGRLMDKDHTTILHHLGCMGLDAREKMLEKTELKLAIKTKLLAQRMEQREKRLRELKEARKKHLNIRAEIKKRVQSERKQVFDLYKKGVSYADITKRTGLAHGRIQALLIYHPDYRKFIRHPGTRPVIQLTKDGVKLAQFPSIISAAKAVGVARGSISLVCRGRIPSSGGYKWKYVSSV